MGAGPRLLALHGLGLTCVHWLRTVRLTRLRGAEVLYVGPVGAGGAGLLAAGTMGCPTHPSSFWHPGSGPVSRCPWPVHPSPFPLASSPFTLHTDFGGGVHYPPPGSAVSPMDLGEHLLSSSSLAHLPSHQWGCTTLLSGLWARSCLAPRPCLVHCFLQLDPSSPSGPYLGAAAPAVGVTC